MSTRVLTSVFVIVLAVLGGSFAGATTEKRLGAPSRRPAVSAEGFRQLMQSQSQQHRITLETCAERMMLDDEFLECVREDFFYTADCGGALLQRTSGWGSLDGLEVCCGDSISCCEVSGAGVAVGTIFMGVIFLSVVLASCACCRYVHSFVGYIATPGEPSTCRSLAFRLLIFFFLQLLPSLSLHVLRQTRP